MITDKEGLKHANKLYDYLEQECHKSKQDYCKQYDEYCLWCPFDRGVLDVILNYLDDVMPDTEESI